MEHKTTIIVLLILTIAYQVHAIVNCTETGPGRFPEDDDTTCKSYTLCLYDSSTGTYLAYNYVCPPTSVFNPNTEMCTSSSNYACNVTLSNSTSVCTEDSYIADPDSTNCTTYIECVEINSTFIETTYTCPDGTYFDPNTTLCESNYTCTTSPKAFTCTSAGRFANTADTNCKNYYFCVLPSNGTYLQYEYTCPSTSVFNPTEKLCTTSYICSSF